MKPSRARFWTLGALRAGLLSACALLVACTTPREPYSLSEASVATVGVGPFDRTWGDRPSDEFLQHVNRAIRRASAATGPTYLTLSGGGGDGAYGAGLLNGWTRSGKRPRFTMVTGVSTGALMAPFAFLGSRYDPVLTEVYTSGVAETLISSPNALNALFGSSIFSNDRLSDLVKRYVTPEIVAEVAREAERDRLLFVITTNFDSERPVIWNMGEIARQGTPASVDLFRSVLVASASIPAVFPPVLIPADANGRRVEEMHVDGSVSGNLFTVPRSYLFEGHPPLVHGGKIYIVLNGTPLPTFMVTENKTTSVVARTISMSFKQQVQSDLQLTYDLSRRLKLDYNLTYIDPIESPSDQFGFDTTYMRRLYQRGLGIGQTGSFWRKAPPREGVPARLIQRQPSGSTVGAL